MANGNGSGISQFINLKTIITGCVMIVLAFTATNLLAVKENTRVNQEQEKILCKAEEER